MKKVITITTILFSGLIAGLLFGFSCAVNLGLHDLSDAEYIRAMQAINIEIQNPVFILVFMGLLVLLPLSAWSSFSSGNKKAFFLLLGATLLYFIGVMGVTALGNIPLNDQLAKVDPSGMSEQALSALRMNFETSWTKFHLTRTLASIISFLLTIFASFTRL